MATPSAVSLDLEGKKDAAEICAQKARQISSVFSRRIPASTHVTVSNGTVAVVTDGATAPNAAPFEGAELHPLWARVGSWRYSHFHWGQQPLRPYMLEAALATLDDMAVAYYDGSVRDYLLATGWKPT